MQLKGNTALQGLITRKHTVLALAMTLAPALVQAQTPTGTLDASFGNRGTVTTDFAGLGDRAVAAAIQDDGKIVAAGFTTATVGYDFAVARYNVDGTLDASFGTGGKVTTDLGGIYEFATAVAVQPDGKIVAAGGSVANVFNDFALVRYNVDGTLDAGFGRGGKVLTEFGVSAQAYSVAVQPDGKIVAAGEANIDGGYDFEVVRYNTNGTLDNTFGTGGKVSTAFGVAQQGFSYALGNSLALQQDGKIVVAGEAFIGSGYDFALARYNSNGALDTTFGGGRVTTDFGPRDSASSVAVQPDGQIVAGGLANSDFALARYTASGALDANFGSGGKVTTDISGLTDWINAIALEPSGKIFAVGVTFVNDSFQTALAQYNASGTLDAGFGTGGKLTPTFGFPAGLSSPAVQQDGKVVVAGGATPTEGNNDFFLVRFGTTGGGSTVPAGASADGTTVPPAPQIVDNAGANWTIGANQAILRNGVQAAGGRGFQILWKSNAIYVLGLDHATWYQWNGTGWVNIGPVPPGGSGTSPDGTTVPPAPQIVDGAGAVWTIGANQTILRNGAQAAGGFGWEIIWKSNTIYVLGLDHSTWYQWSGSGWVNVGSVPPGGTGI